MKPDIAKKWAEALRSGEYEQGSRQLIAETATGTKYCCLGVLCDLYLKEVKPSDARWDYDNDTFLDRDDHDEHELLPAVVQDWAGMHDEVGTFADNTRTLIGCNDEYGQTFDDIADIIENHAGEL